MSRYVGNGRGEWIDEDVYRYRPSEDDRAMARDVAEAIAAKRAPGRTNPIAWRIAWHRRGLLGEIAALHPIGSGPDVEIWESGGGWYGRPDYGTGVDVRTTSRWQLHGFATSKHAKEPGLGGWRITAKDRGRQIVCVEDRDADLLVLGWCYADEIPRLRRPDGAIVAVIEPTRYSTGGDLRPLSTLEAFAFAFAQ